LRGVSEVVINGEVVDGNAAPLYVHEKQVKPSEAS
jgi:ATP-dependent Clp protease ATP-binding subunit ClpX